MSPEVEIIDQTIGSAEIMINMYTYQHVEYIRAAINSVLMQKTGHKWKLLIMDDGSTDGTQEVLKHFQKEHSDRIILAMSHKNSRSIFQRDVLFKYRDTKYINELDGDDYWTDAFKLEKQVTFLEKHPEYVGVTGNVKNINEDGEKQHCDFDLYPFQESHVFKKENVLRMEQVSHCSALVFRNFYKEWDREKINKIYSCKANGDLVRSSVLGMLGDIYYSHEVYTDHRRVFTGTSWTAQTYGKNNSALLLEMWEDLYRLIYEMFGERIQIDDFRQKMKAMIGKEIEISNKVSESAKQRNIFRMLDMWELSNKSGNRIETILMGDGIKSIAIYGLAQLGIRLFYELKHTSVKTVYGIDMNRAMNIPGLECFHKIPDEKPYVDAIVVTALTTFDDIRERLENIGYSRVIALDELLYRMVPGDPYLKE